MSQTVPPVSVLQKAYLDQLDYIQKHSDPLQPCNKEQLDALRKKAATPLTIQQLGALAALPIVNSNAGYYPLSPLKGDPLETTCLQFGHSSQEWYFFYGNAGQVAFTVALFAFPVCCPAVAKQNGLSVAQAHVYQIAGGMGVPGQWYTIPSGTFLQGLYQPYSQSTFIFTGVPTSDSAIASISIVSATLGSFQFNVAWKDGTATRSLQSTFVANNPPMYNGPKGCQPICISALGSLYWSYTNLSMQVTANLGTGVAPIQGQGKGWMDHQWIQSGKLKNPLTAAVRNLNTSIHPSPIGRWLWLNIQDEVDGRQFMIYVPIGTDLVQVGKQYRPAFTNLYDNQTGMVTLPVKSTTVTALEMKTVNNYTFPTQYRIKIDLPEKYQKDSKKTQSYLLSLVFGDALIYTPLGLYAWEAPGALVDADDNRPRGYSFMEANFMAPTEQVWRTWAGQAGFTGDEAVPFAPHRAPMGSVVLSSLLLTSLVVAILSVLIGLASMLLHRRKKVKTVRFQ